MNPPARLAAFSRSIAHGALPETSSATRPNTLVLHCAAILVFAFLFACCSDPYGNIANLDSSGTTIVCFGDSITAGHGVSAEQSFPYLISERLGINVINAGRDGDTASDGFARLEEDVPVHDARIVIVEFGGNDFLKKVDKTETLANMERIVERITEQGAMVVLLEIRVSLFGGNYLEGYREIAEEHGSLLIPNFVAGIVGNHKLTVDGVHPNPEGHELIAERVIEKLVPLLERADRSRSATRLPP